MPFSDKLNQNYTSREVIVANTKFTFRIPTIQTTRGRVRIHNRTIEAYLTKFHSLLCFLATNVNGTSFTTEF